MPVKIDKANKGINTPYDSVFKSIFKKCPRMALFLINEMFYKTGLSDEEYDGTEKIESLDRELPDPEFGNLELDMRLAVSSRRGKRTFHIECQSTADGTIILRMFRYDTISALEEAEYSSSCIRLKLDESGILFLRSTKNTPAVMTVILEAPRGQFLSYQLPVMRMQDYSLDYIIRKKLFILLPFLFFNYEKQLRKSPENTSVYNEILKLYDTIIKALKELSESRIISAYEADTLYGSLKIVFEALGKTNKAEKEVEKIMGGEILEFRADKYYNAGRTDGEAKGRADGEAKGRADGEAIGEQKMAELMNLLLSDGKTEEAVRAAKDKEYRDSLFKEYAIV